MTSDEEKLQLIISNDGKQSRLLEAYEEKEFEDSKKENEERK